MKDSHKDYCTCSACETRREFDKEMDAMEGEDLQRGPNLTLWLIKAITIVILIGIIVVIVKGFIIAEEISHSTKWSYSNGKQ